MGLPSAAEAKQLLKSFTSERPRPREGKTKQTEWPAAASGRKRNTCKRDRILHLQNKNRMLGLKSIEGCKGVRKVDGKSKRLGTVVRACYRKKGQCKELSIKKKKIARPSAQAWNPRHLGGSSRRITDSRAAWAAEWIQDQGGQSSKTLSRTSQN